MNRRPGWYRVSSSVSGPLSPLYHHFDPATARTACQIVLLKEGFGYFTGPENYAARQKLRCPRCVEARAPLPEKPRYRRDDEGKRHRVVMYDGFEGYYVRWTARCTGCSESCEGQMVVYDTDKKSGEMIGIGCSECGYTGKVRQVHWVPFDKKAYGRHETERWKKEQAATRAAAQERFKS